MLVKALAFFPEVALAREFGRWRMLGVLAAGCSVYVRVIAVIELAARGPGFAAGCYFVAKMLAMAAMLGVAWVSRPADDEADRFGLRLWTPIVVGAMAAAAGLALTCGIRIGVILCIGAYFIARLTRAWFNRWRGGITGNGLLVCVLAVETFALTVLAAQRAARL